VTAPLSRQNVPFLLYDWLDVVDLTTRERAWILSDECSFTTGFTFDISGGRTTY
jgi:hypothetical protein